MDGGGGGIGGRAKAKKMEESGYKTTIRKMITFNRQ